jgi:hypothetical protein
VLEFPEPKIALGTLDQGRNSDRERGVREYLGNVADEESDALARWKRSDVENHLLVARFQRIGDQVDFVGPVPVDRRFAHASSGGD